LLRDLRLRRTDARLGQRASTARLVPCGALAPAARASSPLGDYARRERSKERTGAAPRERRAGSSARERADRRV